MPSCRFFPHIIMASLALVFASAPALAEKRVALVIGNGAYQSVAGLPNPPRDAEAIAGLFRAAGFDDVKVETDVGVAAMRRVLRAFADKAAEADIAVVFFAGHGVEIGGRNYLMPVDAALRTDLDVQDEAIDLDRVLQLLDRVKRLKLVILDACRENPFAARMKLTSVSRSVGRGLAPPEPQTSNTLVAYAARAGAIAADGDARNSPFTTALLHHLTKPGLDM
ncbi:caspase family protein [Methylocystis sp. H4A]|uniref:caspase family protein n=1 Tax=Methylocystis sp. H4A TaxID=2785788 RepID=UPI0018C26453|nr:caspase family protein [Methylocystis sp. H4A]MBG0800771.1 caspase family protein [Methylocystis sp. H4A]